MTGSVESVEIVGLDGRVHTVQADQADLFRNGHDGGPLTDQEWDEQKRRLDRDNSDLIPEEFRA